MTVIHAADSTLFEKINGMAGAGGAADSVMLFTAEYSPVIFAIVLVILWLRWRRDSQRASALAAGAALIALGIGQIIGKTFPRARPSDVIPAHLLIPHSLDTSFPSDHATLAFAIAAVVFSWNRRWGWALITFAVLTALARIWVGAHYPGDVIGGAVLGGTVAAVVVALANTERGRTLSDSVLDFLHRLRVAA